MYVVFAAFQSEFVSLKQYLGDVEADILGPEPDVPDKDLRRMLGDICHSVGGDDMDVFNTTEKVCYSWSLSNNISVASRVRNKMICVYPSKMQGDLLFS